MTKGKSLKGRHFIITGRASICIITILICWSLWRKRWRSGETTKASLSSYDTIDTGVHPTQPIRESVKASIHALKLHRDSLKGHTTSWGKRSSHGRNSRSCRTSSLHMWPLQSKLGLAPPNRTGIYGTHGSVVWRAMNGDGKMANDPRDTWRKNELITGCRILIDIKDRSDKVKGEVNRKILEEWQKKTSTRLCDRVIVR